MVGVDLADEDALGAAGGDGGRGLAGHAHQHGVEELAVHHLDAALDQAGGQHGGHPVGAPRDRPEPGRPVVHGVHRGDHREQDLRGADVARGLVAADVLLAGLQGEAVGGVAVGVDRRADETPGQLAREALADGEEPGVRAAEAERHPEALGGADRDVGAQVAGRGDHGGGEQVAGGDHRGTAVVHGLDHRAVVAQRPGRAGGGEQEAEEVVVREFRR